MYQSSVFFVCVLISQFLGLNAQTKIVGGTRANIADYPYQISIMSNGVHSCGGAILDFNTIITAAHCVHGEAASNLRIRAGSSSRLSGGTVIGVQRYVKHPRFNANTLDFDMALIHLRSNLTFSDTIQPIRIYRRQIYGGWTVVATGWGTQSEGGALSTNLRKTTLPIQNRRTCRRVWGTSLDVSMFCAGRMTGGVDTCQGDSGGPLVYNGFLVGITSHGNGCGRRGFPGLNTKVPLLRRWILNNMN